MEQRELIERLVPLIPPPRAHQVRYHGILAPAAGLRDRIVPRSDLDADEHLSQERSASTQQASEAPPSPDEGNTRPSRVRWAKLLMRVFEIDALRCPECGARLRLLAAIEDPDVASKILACLDLPARAPPLQPAPAAAVRVEADHTEDDFDQTPALSEPW